MVMMNECVWCGQQTPYEYCNERCRQNDAMPLCEGCGDKIDIDDDWRYMQTEDDVIPYHDRCAIDLMICSWCGKPALRYNGIKDQEGFWWHRDCVEMKDFDYY